MADDFDDLRNTPAYNRAVLAYYQGFWHEHNPFPEGSANHKAFELGLNETEQSEIDEMNTIDRSFLN